MKVVDRLEFYREGDAWRVTSTLSGNTGSGPTKLWALFDFAVVELGAVPQVSAVRRGLFLYGLNRLGGNKKATARAIGISYRTALYWSEKHANEGAEYVLPSAPNSEKEAA